VRHHLFYLANRMPEGWFEPCTWLWQFKQLRSTAIREGADPPGMLAPLKG